MVAPEVHPVDSTHAASAPLRASDTYLKNMIALWRTDPLLAMALDALTDDALPPAEPARDGHPTVRLRASTNSYVYLHSKYRPIDEADKWAASVAADGKHVIVVHGFGLGYHLRALWDRLPDTGALIVAEPSLPLLKAALHAADYADLLASGRLDVFTAIDQGRLIERLEPKAILLVNGVAFAAHTPSTQLAPDFHRDFARLFTEFVSYTRTGFVTALLNNVTTCRNIANNLGRYITTAPIDLLHKAFPGKPAILVAAGPSLAKNMHLLHEAKGKAVIIAVQTMLKPLLAAGIEPDFVTSLDYNTVSTRFFENLEDAGSTGQVHLVAEPKAHWNVLDTFQGTMSVLANDFASGLLRDAAPPRPALKPGATVAHLSFYLAEFLGCDPVILVGQDLGFVDGLYYKPGVAIHDTWAVELGRFNTLETKEWERIVRSRPILRKIPDIHGHPMYTEEQFFVYLQQFERDFAASRTRIIDATEGGAKKQHVEPMLLRQALDTYCQLPITNDQLPAPWKTWHCNIPSELDKAISALRARQSSCDDMLATCDQTIPLLEEMIEKQHDARRMNELFVSVDHMRTRAARDPITFEMVCQLNTIGELRRFQNDLGVKTSGPDSIERQKRQLLRDLDYVKNLRVGCERLHTILTEAQERLNAQHAAALAGKPWPKSIAGS